MTMLNDGTPMQAQPRVAMCKIKSKDCDTSTYTIALFGASSIIPLFARAGAYGLVHVLSGRAEDDVYECICSTGTIFVKRSDATPLKDQRAFRMFVESHVSAHNPNLHGANDTLIFSNVQTKLCLAAGCSPEDFANAEMLTERVLNYYFQLENCFLGKLWKSRMASPQLMQMDFSSTASLIFQQFLELSAQNCSPIPDSLFLSQFKGDKKALSQEILHAEVIPHVHSLFFSNSI